MKQVTVICYRYEVYTGMFRDSELINMLHAFCAHIMRAQFKLIDDNIDRNLLSTVGL